MKNICFVATVPEVINSFLTDVIFESSKKWDISDKNYQDLDFSEIIKYFQKNINDYKSL